ncbi:hypothetical protein CP532_6308 [Ophiocordyceps camponoti-leonardi (nom. inval.)]|nr:hypothetical protein CP532_6308 [Ophiocordyceps camponoti-leonardi (nom. inval.)]
MLEARLEQANILKKLVDAIKDLVQDCNFDCNDSGIALQAMDNSHVALVSMMLKAEGFSPYRCDRNIPLGINLASLTKVLRAAQNEDILTLKAQDAPDVLNLVFESSENDRISEYDLKLMDIDQEHLGIPDTEYAASITMPAAEFRRICTDLAAVSESVSIEASKDGIKFSCNGDIGNGSVVLRSHTNVDKPDLNVDINLTEPVSLTFSLKYLVNFCKATTLSNTVKLCLSSEVPLLVEYNLAGSSYLRFYLAPKVAVLVLQSLGYDVAALNTVQFSNHTGYGQWTGDAVTADAITDLWSGLKQSYLDDMDMMLSGYVPGAEAVAAVGAIAKELKAKEQRQGIDEMRGRFFWVLDPVMGDNGHIYVAEDVVPAYKSLVPHADLVLPNQFEAELLSGISIVDMKSLVAAIQALHDQYHVPHVVVTSVRLDAPHQPARHLAVMGSSVKSDGKARLFKIVFPSIDAYFSGTGDMFGALITMRMREAVFAVPGLSLRPSWLSDDDTPALQLPLARATEKVLASLHDVLSRTRDAMPTIIRRTQQSATAADGGEERARCIQSKAAELQLVQNLDCLRHPKADFKAELL